MAYSSLHNHSQYSVLDGFGFPKEYLDRASELGCKAFAITEHGNQYSWVYFDEIKNNYPDLKMIYGVELYICDDIEIKDKDSKYYHLIALAKNEAGRKALNNIVTRSNFEGFYYKPRVDLSMLSPHADNLVIMTACLASELSRTDNYSDCVKYIEKYKGIFPHFYLEMQSHSTKDQEQYNKKLLKLAKETNTKFTITTDSHTATEKDLEYQAYHVRIARDSETLNEIYSGCYIQSEDEIHAIMDKQIGVKNVTEGLENTNEVADLIDVVDMSFQEPQLPHFPLPPGFNTAYDYLVHLVKLGWEDRKIDERSSIEIEERRKRLEYELEIIHQMDYDGYFLIVWDFIKYAKNNDIIVGDGRGSAGGSLVVYLLGITELDPIDNNLIFERFLNPERINLPDVDIDLADREAVIRYLINKYGEEKVCQIINFSYITPIVAIKDVGRVLNIPYYITDKISKSFTCETFEECLESNPGILETYYGYEELFEIASKISGRVRNVSVHAGGVGIVNTAITDYMGMKLGKKDEHVIQVDKNMIERIGIVKFDILGVSTLSIVQNVVKDVGINLKDFTINNPKFAHDEAMFKLLQSARTNGVFQVESAGMKDLLIRLQPTSLNDISAVLALYRPDSMLMLEDYIKYKHNPDQIEYWHEDLISILQETYGALIYQEQIMDIVRKFGGRTYGGADLFRKAVGKKDKDLIQLESQKLYNEIIAQGYEESVAEKISNHLTSFGGYCFNRSHSQLYSVLTLKTAYLKAHYPAHFFCHLLNQNRNDFGVVNKYIVDAKSFGIEVVAPKINESEKLFTVKNGKILYGMEAIRGIGEKLAEQIINERNENGKYKSFQNFLERTGVTTSSVVMLIKSGAIPCKNKSDYLIKYAKSLYEYSKYKPVTTLPKLSILNEEYGINTDEIKDKSERLRLYNIGREVEHERKQQDKFKKHMDAFVEKNLQNEDFWEFEALSTFISNNPFDEAYKYINTTFNEVEDGEDAVIVGIVAGIQKKKDRNNKQFAFINIHSADGLIETTCWHEQYKKYENLISRGNQVALICKKNNDKAVVKELKTYAQWLQDRNIVEHGGKTTTIEVGA